MILDRCFRGLFVVWREESFLHAPAIISFSSKIVAFSARAKQQLFRLGL